MADLTELKMNMAALKRVDPYIKDILETGTHVALYIFNAVNNGWEKTDVEGALFVYSRNGEPYNSILIMNRLNTNNLMEPVTQKLDLELQEPFLLYRNSKCVIYGIWFYYKDECIRISTMLKRLVEESETKIRKSNSNLEINKKPIVNNKPNSNTNVDIFSMLSKAQENFNTSRESNGNDKDDNPKSPDTANENVGSFATPVTSSTSNNRGLFDVTSQSVVDFFAKAKVNTSQYKPVDHQQSPGNVHVPSDNKPFLLARLMSHSAAHTLEHIEKQQKSTTPQSIGIPSILPPTTVPISVKLTKNGGTSTNKMKKSSKSTSSHTEGSGISTEMLQELADQRAKNTKPSTNSTNDSKISSFLRIQSPASGPLSKVLSNHPQSHNIFNASNSQSVPFPSMETQANKITKSTELTGTQSSLLTDSISTLPMRFSSIVDLDCTNKSNESDELMGTRGLHNTSTIAPALIPPVMFSASSPSESTSNRPLVEPLTKNQLLQAINYLLKNDPDFMRKLHEAYIKSFNEILS